MEQQVERWTPLISLLCAIMWTWPLVLQMDMNPSRHFDAYGLLWLTEGIQHLKHGIFEHSNFPHGQNIGHIDSWIYFGLAWMCGELIPPPMLLSLLILLGISSSIWMMSICAQSWGVRGLNALSVGLLFGLNGLVLNAILEGAYYFTVLAWLPGLAWAIRRYSQYKQTLHAFWTVMMWLGCLLTSAYLGIVGSLVLLLLIIHLLPRHNKVPWLLSIVIPIVVLGAAYSIIFFGNTTHRAHDFIGIAEDWTSMGSSNLWNILLWNTNLDTDAHSLGPVSNVFLIVMLCIAPLTRIGQHWSVWWAIGVISLMLSFGYQISATEIDQGIPWLFWMFQDWSIVNFIHFPVRLHWGLDLAGALLLGQLLQRGTQNNPKIAVWGFGLILFQCTVIQGVWVRQSSTPYHTSEIYKDLTGSGALLELHPIFSSRSDIEPLLIKNVLCSQQIYHHKPLLKGCMGTTTSDSNDWKIRTILMSDILDSQSISWGQLFPSLGVDTLLVHIDWFQTSDAIKIESYLTQTLGQPNTSADGSILYWTFVDPEKDHELLLQNYTALYNQHL